MDSFRSRAHREPIASTSTSSASTSTATAGTSTSTALNRYTVAENSQAESYRSDTTASDSDTDGFNSSDDSAIRVACEYQDLAQALENDTSPSLPSSGATEELVEEINSVLQGDETNSTLQAYEFTPGTQGNPIIVGEVYAKCTKIVTGPGSSQICAIEID